MSSSGSPAIGIRPLPSLPVDSAMSCSAQAPKSAIFLEARIVTLSRPSRPARPMARPSCTPGFSRGGTSGPQERTIASACLMKLPTSMPAVAGLAIEDPGIVELLGGLLERGAGIGHRDEAMSGLHRGPDGLSDAIVEIILHRVRLGRPAGLAGHDEHGLGDVDLGLRCAHLGRV